MFRFLLSLLILTPFLSFAQHPSCDSTRYLLKPFNAVDTTFGIQYGSNTTLNGQFNRLKMDIFEPQGDTALERPLIVLAFGGSFISGSREDMHNICQHFAQQGYVAATIDYRLFDLPFFPLPDSTDFMDEAVKAMMDMKAAIRFFREDAATSNTYRIDPNFIIAGGISSGGITASHVAYVDSTDTIEALLRTKIQTNGGFEGNSSTNTQYSSEVQAVVNFSGALRSASYIDANDPPLFSVHDDQDGVVPFGNGSAKVSIFPIITVQGSRVMTNTSNQKGVSNQLIIIPNSTGHVSYFNQTWQDSIFGSIDLFLHDIYCAQQVIASVGETAPIQRVSGKIYPNPADYQMTVELDEVPSNYSVQLFDMMGREVANYANQSDDQVLIEKQGWGAGLYILRISFDNRSYQPIVQKVRFN